ncbi:DUF5000 domain-containing lipoprotein [Niabella beijingensis]|uniref:DUF5000 domain-containing lipoprotein n=1 Tax=Niabella beijingensis TaxID=2872700 RepID=UPI001CBAC8FC|nr:DUF5000 domain-containing lipoprotein [Niabella beijingensis]MBZ4190525.1 DUF4959 domain-containing protein [Niabella beijingensis]
MLKMKQLFPLVITLLVVLGCKRQDNYINYTDATLPAPAQVYDLRVTSVAGGAYIVYKVPGDSNLRYVKAVYETAPGTKWEVKASYFNDTLKVEGFGDTSIHEVQIYSVGKNEKESSPVVVQVKPLLPAIMSVYKTVAISGTFGGVNVRLQNPGRSNLAVVVLHDPLKDGNLKELTTYYSAADRISFSVRGMDTTDKKISLYLRDRWNNKTAATTALIKPLYEELIDKASWKPLYLPGDTYDYVEGYVLPKLWDNGLGYCCLFASKGYTFPHTITIDFGKQVVLSRMKTWQHPESPYNGPSVKEFEVWGSNTFNPDGDYEDPVTKTYRSNWVRLGVFSSYKPSGAPLGTVTNEDRDYALNKGEDFEFEAGLPAVRYLRFKTTATYANTAGQQGAVVLQELTLWGQEIK